MLATKEFLQTVITGIPEQEGEPAYFCLAIGNNETSWKEIWFNWPDDIDSIVETSDKLCEETNVYFSTYLFKTRSTTKDNVLPTKTIQADLDEADINNLPIPPTVLVQTSSGRHQGYWLLSDFNDLELHEVLSRKLTYAITNCDHSGWPLGRKVRIPNTYNYKYSEGRQPVRVVSFAKRVYEAAHLELLPDAPTAASEEIDDKFLSEPPPVTIGPQELLNKIKDKIPVEVYNTYNNQAQDRSLALWKLMCAAFRAGLSRDEVYWLAKGSANNKFTSLRFNGDRELAKDVLRAEAVVSSGIADTRDMIARARKLAGSQHDKRQHMLDIVFDMMSVQGKFTRTQENNNYYIRQDVGRPILLTERSEYLLTLLDMEFGLNPTEPETKYVSSGLCNKVREIKSLSESAALCFYDKPMETMFLHTGRKDVVRITKNSIGTVTDGAFDLIFPWANGQEQFKLDFGDLPAPWEEILFGDTVNNVMGMDRNDALALLRTWFIFIFFRKDAVSRPILALFGQPGCLAGETSLYIKRGNHSPRDYTIATAYAAFNGGYNNTRKWDLTIPTKIMSMKDGILTWRNIKDIIFSGNKETYTVKIDNCAPIRTTLDHRFLTPQGYKTLGELTTGDFVITKGGPLGGGGRYIRTRRTVAAKYHPLSRKHEVYGHEYGEILYARCVIEAHNNHISTDEFVKIINTDEARAKEFSYLPKNIVIHHEDENPENDSYDNLIVTTKLEHDTYHGYKNQRNLGAYSGLFEGQPYKIISIEHYGIEPTYDITMEDEDAPNFVAENIVVHNSGKSTTFRKVYALLYGKHKSLGAVTTPEDFDYAVSGAPLVVLDNVDSWERWLPDRLALAASTSDIDKRKLYTDLDTITVKRQSILAVTAHDPKFGREDVTDRLLILNLKRLDNFRPETPLINVVLNNRNKLFGALVKDIQRVLGEEEPQHHDIPQIRVEDFARVGYRIACALGIQKEFSNGIKSLRSNQKAFLLEQDSILVDAIKKLIQRDTKAGDFKYRTAGEMWVQLEALTEDKVMKEMYHNAPSLGKKLWTLYDALKIQFDVTVKFDTTKGSKTWCFKSKEEVTNGT